MKAQFYRTLFVLFFMSVNVDAMIAAGEFHSLAGIHNSLYVYGDGKKGGLGMKAKMLDTPTPIPHLPSMTVVQLAAGNQYSLILTSDGRVFSFGKGSKGRLGHGNEMDRMPPKRIDGLKGVNIVQVSAGYSHSLAVSDKGNVYSFGESVHGSLGYPADRNQNLPKIIEYFSDNEIKIVEAVASQFYSLFLTDNGEVYSCGLGEVGALGHGDFDNQELPKKIAALDDISIKQISARSSHSLVLSNTGEVYSFGLNDVGQLGHGDVTENLNTPTLIEFFRDIPILKIATGSAHSLVLTRDEKKLYGFGYNNSAQLGRVTVKTNVAKPVHIKLLDNTNIIEISAGRAHSLVRTEDGEIYSFGWGQSGQLGHGNKKSSMPKLIMFPH